MRKLGGDEADGAEAIAAGAAPAEGGKVAVKKDWVPCPNPDGVVREVKEKRVISREETEETKETEDIQHLGDITDEVRIKKLIIVLTVKESNSSF